MRDDQRQKVGWDTGELIAPGGMTFTGNLCVPVKAYKEVGGLDENIVGHGGEDCDFGKALTTKGYLAYFSEWVRGYHLHHSPPPDKEIRAFLDASAAYFDRNEPVRISTRISYQDSRKKRYVNQIDHNLEIYKDIGYIRIKA